jgi:hypothetical protein
MIEETKIEHGGFIATLSGIVTSNEISEACAIGIELLHRQPYAFQIFIMRDIEDVTISARKMQLIAIQDAEEFRQYGVKKVAIVAESELAVGITNIYRSFHVDEDHQTETFQSFEDALVWVKAPLEV